MNFRFLFFWLVVVCAACSSESSSESAAQRTSWVSRLGLEKENDKYLSLLDDSMHTAHEKFSNIKLNATINNQSLISPFLDSDSGRFKFEINCENELVKSVSIDVFPFDSSQTQEGFKSLSEYFQARYGEGSITPNYAVWYVGKNTEISLIDESENYGKPYIALIYYKEEGIAN